MDNTAKLRPFYIAKILHEKTDDEAGFRLTKDSPPQNPYQHHAPVKLCLYGCFAFIICRSLLNTKTLDKNGICRYNKSIKILSDIKGYCNSK